jgi:hypothetical protein
MLEASKKHKVTFLALLFFLLLNIIYFRYVIFSSADAFITRHIATDIYGHFAHVVERLELLKKGILPIGDYWVPRGGGFPAATNDQLLIPQEFIMMLLYAVIGDLILSQKLTYFIFYFLSLIFSYWYGLILLKRKDASIFLAVAYTFSMYGVNQLEHVDLIGVPFLIILALIFLEKSFNTKKPRYALLASFSTFLIFLTNLYALAFTGFFIFFRLIFQLLLENALRDRIMTLRIFLIFGLLTLFLCMPHIISHSYCTPSKEYIESFRNQLIYQFSASPHLYFLRNAPFIPYKTEIYFMYLGLIPIVFSLLPIILGFNRFPDLKRLYLFHMFITIFFMVYSIGSYSPVNLALLIHDYVPLLSFIRVPGRSLMIGYLSIYICASIGYIHISDLLKQKISNPKKVSYKRIIPIILLSVTVLATFCDLTVGFEPAVMPMVLKDDEAFHYIKSQPDNFRIIEIPSVHDQQAMTYIYTGHDTLNPVLWAFGFFKPLHRFKDLYLDYIRLREAPYAAETSEDLVAYWSFDHIQENKILDSSKYNNDGNAFRVNPIEGIFGAGLEFHGSDNYVRVQDSKSLRLDKHGTIEFWTKLPSEEEAAPQGWIVGKGGGWDRPGWLVTTINKNHIRFQWQSGKDVILDSATALSYGEWHHVVCLTDGHSMRIYIDGKQDPNILMMKNVSAISTTDLYLGLSDTGQLQYKGLIDEVKIYDCLLTPQQIKSEYLLGLAHLMSTKSAYYGVKYIILRLNPEFLEDLYIKYQATLSGEVTSYEEVCNVKTHLDNLNEDYRLAYVDENSGIYVYENLRYKGMIFPLPLSVASASTNSAFEFFASKPVKAEVTYHWLNPNTIKIHVKNSEPTLLIVSQSYSEGWVAIVKSITATSNITTYKTPISIGDVQAIRLEIPGKHEITLHYWHYENSLLLLPIYYVPIAIITYGVFFERNSSKGKDASSLRKSVLLLLIYGATLILFSIYGYPLIFPKIFTTYYLSILYLGIFLILNSALICLINALQKFFRAQQPLRKR